MCNKRINNKFFYWFTLTFFLLPLQCPQKKFIKIRSIIIVTYDLQGAYELVAI